MSRTPEQMMIRLLREKGDPGDLARQDLIRALEAHDKHMLDLRGGWWNLPEGMRRRLIQERSLLVQAAHDLLQKDRHGS